LNYKSAALNQLSYADAPRVHQEFVMTLFAQRVAKRTKIFMVFFYRRTPGSGLATESVQRTNRAAMPAAVDAVGFSEILRSFK
jgi:hypothetical protein